MRRRAYGRRELESWGRLYKWAVGDGIGAGEEVPPKYSMQDKATVELSALYVYLKI